MQTIRRAVVASALAFPLTIGAAGIASADTFDHNAVSAGEHGVAVSNTHSSTGQQSGGGNGGASFEHNSSNAGPDGAASERTKANADGEGGTSYEHNQDSAGPDGASSESTSSSTGGGQQDGALSGLVGGLGL